MPLQIIINISKVFEKKVVAMTKKIINVFPSITVTILQIFEVVGIVCNTGDHILLNIFLYLQPNNG